MQIAVTGANGFVGRAVDESLSAAGHTVTALVRAARQQRNARSRAAHPRRQLRQPRRRSPSIAALRRIGTPCCPRARHAGQQRRSSRRIPATNVQGTLKRRWRRVARRRPQNRFHQQCEGARRGRAGSSLARRRSAEPHRPLRHFEARSRAGRLPRSASQMASKLSSFGLRWFTVPASRRTSQHCLRGSSAACRCRLAPSTPDAA